MPFLRLFKMKMFLRLFGISVLAGKISLGKQFALKIRHVPEAGDLEKLENFLLEIF